MKGEDPDAIGGMQCNIAEEMSYLRHFLRRVFDSVENDRAKTLLEVKKWRKKVAELQEELDFLEKNEAPDDKSSSSSSSAGSGKKDGRASGSASQSSTETPTGS